MGFTRGLNITYFCDAEADRSTSWEQYAVVYCAAEQTSYVLHGTSWIPLGKGITVNELPVVDVAHGGTGLNAIAAGSIMAANSANTITAITSTSGLKVLSNNAGTTAWNTTTGTNNVVFSTSPTFDTSVIGSSTMAVFNTASTTINAFGAATTLNIGNITVTGIQTINFGNSALGGLGGAQTINIGSTTTATNGQVINIGTTGGSFAGNNISIGRGTGAVNIFNVTSSVTLNLANGATASGNAKTINIGTAGDNGSTTTITIGSNVSGSTTDIIVHSSTFKLNLGSDATGDIYYRNSSGNLTRLGIGSTNQVLTVSGGLPVWAAAPGGGGGTVTSVDMTVPTGFTIGGNPITTTGTLALTFTSGYSLPTTASQTDWNTAFGWGNHATAGYLTTSAAASTYQPLDGDLTSIAGLAGTSGLLRKTAANTFTLDTTSYIDNTVTTLSSLTSVGTLTSGTISTGFVVAGVTMTLGSDATGDIYYRNSGGVLTRLGIGSTNQVLTVISGLPSWQTPSGGTLTVGTSAITSGTANRILFENGSNVLDESSNLVWDSTNSRIGIGTTTTTSYRMTLMGEGNSASTTTYSLKSTSTAGTAGITVRDDGRVDFFSPGSGQAIFNGGAAFYQVQSPNGASKINMDGGNMNIYNGNGSLHIQAAGSRTYIGKVTKIDDTVTASSPDASSLLELSSTTKGFLTPRMTGAQAEAISTPATGLMIYSTNGNGSTITTTGFWYYNGSAWSAIGGAGSGTVTSVSMTVPTGFTIGGSPVTTSGTLAITFTSGYSLPTTASQTNWDTAFGWGNHASAGYLTTASAASTYQPLDSDLTSIAALTTTSFGRGLLTETSASTLRSTLTLVIGTDVQAWDGDLDAIAALVGTSGFLKKTAANTWSLDTSTYITSSVTTLSSLTTVGTLTSGTLSTGFVVGGVTMTLGSDATGDIYYRNSGGVLTRLGVGSNGNVLTLASGLPSWAAPSGGGLTWNNITGTSQTMSSANGYISNNASLVTLTLPSSSAIGDIIEVSGYGAGGWKIAQGSGQQIFWDAGGVAGTNNTTSGATGYLQSTDRYDSIQIQCVVANTTWVVRFVKGEITLN